MLKTEMLMKRFLLVAALLLLSAAVAVGQTGGARLRGEWEGTGYQSDSNDTWAMRLTVKGRVYAVEYPSLGCSGRWRLLSRSRARFVFRETITKGTEKCAPRGTFIVERLNPRQLGYWYSHDASKEFVASGILNRRR